MRLFGLDISLRQKSQGEVLSLDQLLRRLDAAYETASGISVTPENCEQSSTVQAILTAVTRRFAATPVHVYRTTEKNGRDNRERLPNHPAAKLLQWPNDWQTPASYWQDAASRLLRYGNFYAYKAQGSTGPIRRLLPLAPYNMTVEQQDDLSISYKYRVNSGGEREYPADEVHHVRLRARNGFLGDSPVLDMREAIALEIAMEKFGASFFGNGAVPLIAFQYAMGAKGTKEQRDEMVEQFQQMYSKRNRFRAFFLPKGVEIAGDPIAVQNDKNQFNESRRLIRTVIAGAFGVPPHLVGDLERGTFNNVEQQSLDFVQNVIQPLAKIFEDQMERDLLTDYDWTSGVSIRFNLDGALRGSFKERQEGLKIMRDEGVIAPNDWREREYMNPIEGDYGESYWMTGPSGQASSTAGGGIPEPPAPAPKPNGAAAPQPKPNGAAQ